MRSPKIGTFRRSLSIRYWPSSVRYAARIEKIAAGGIIMRYQKFAIRKFERLITNWVGDGSSAPKLLNTSAKTGMTQNEEHQGDDDRGRDDAGRIDHRALDLAGELRGLLEGRTRVAGEWCREYRRSRRPWTRLVKRSVKTRGVLLARVGERVAGFDVVLHFPR